MRKQLTSRRVLITSFLVDVSDVLLNVIVAMLSGSSVMLAQSLQGAADLLTSGFLLVGLKRSRRPSDARHRFGYGREIYFWTLISGLMMLTVTATISLYQGWQQFAHPITIGHTPLAIAVLLIGVATNAYAFSLSYRRIRGRERHSIWELFSNSVLVETKAAFVLDLMGTISGIFGFLSLGLYALTGNGQFDGLGAMVIGLCIAVLAILLVADVKDIMIGRGAPASLEKEICQTALAIKGVEAVLDLKTMYLGSERLLVNMELDIAPKLKTEEIERLIDIIKAEIKDKVPSVHHLQIELETPGRRKPISVTI